MPTRTAFLFILVFLGLAPFAHAYLRMAPEDSIEWSVFDSDVVVRGVVTSLQPSTTDPAFPHTIISIKVLETLKGNTNPTLTCLADTADIHVFKDGEFLFFLLKTPRQLANRQPTTQQAKIYATYPFVLRNSWGRFPIPLDRKPDRPVFDAYLHPLLQRDQILAPARHEAQNPPNVQFGMLEIQISATSQSFIHPIQGTPYQPAYLNLLVDSRAETRARDWVRSSDPWDRWNGAMVLSHFQSPQNIEIMTALLADPYQADGDWPGGSDFRWISGSGKWLELTRFPMRIVACEALKTWHAEPSEAVVFQPAYSPTYLHRRTLPLILAAIGLLSLLVVAARWVRPVGKIGGFTSLSLLLLIATVALWARSHWEIDEISFKTAPKTRYEIVSLHGIVRINRFEPVVEPMPAMFISVKRDLAAEADWSLASIPPVGNVPAASYGKAGFKAETGGMWTAGFSLQNFRAYSAPLWSFCLLFALLPVTRLLIWLRRRNRIGVNCCPNCGYDLRATPGRCPECGRGFEVA